MNILYETDKELTRNRNAANDVKTASYSYDAENNYLYDPQNPWIQRDPNYPNYPYYPYQPTYPPTITGTGTSVEIKINGDAEKSPLEDEIREVCSELADFLVEKNRKYGNSVSNPVRIFSKADAKEQIRVRIDDKLSRIISSQSDDDEDVINDLLGYLIILKINTESDK